MSVEQVPFATATKGHTIGVRKPTPTKSKNYAVGFKTWNIFCTCGWQSGRPKVERDGKSVMLPIVEFRGLGDKHLYDIWREAQQGRLA